MTLILAKPEGSGGVLAALDLQKAYDNSGAPPHITVNATNGPLTISSAGLGSTQNAMDVLGMFANSHTYASGRTNNIVNYNAIFGIEIAAIVADSPSGANTGFLFGGQDIFSLGTLVSGGMGVTGSAGTAIMTCGSEGGPIQAVIGVDDNVNTSRMNVRSTYFDIDVPLRPVTNESTDLGEALFRFDTVHAKEVLCDNLNMKQILHADSVGGVAKVITSAGGAVSLDIFATAVQDSGDMTINSNTLATIDIAGDYRIDFKVNLEETVGNNRVIAGAAISVNGGAVALSSAATCYIRQLAAGGNRGTATGGETITLAQNDTIEVKGFILSETGTITVQDVPGEANITFTKIG